ncbi:MAG TPA: hypothetical protein VK603_16140 [Candidatus Saccharimonadales bacterium]|nr:hypothetical protein [Candidatus Saccharimonadales bacterium]
MRIARDAVGLDRMKNGSMIPLLDSHQSAGIHNALGRFKETWFNRGALMGKIIFNQTPNGKLAEGMVERGEIAGISAGYCVREWEITDDGGKVLDPDNTQIRWDDNLTFTATRWDLHEASLVAVPADHLSGIRSIGSGADRSLPQVDELRNGAIRITKRFGDCSISYDYPDLRRKPSLIDVRARMKARQAISDRMSRA